MKVLLIVLDGLGDRPVKSLGGKTPLDAAKKPNLNWMCSHGKTGIMHIIGKGIAPESDEAALAMLGYDPFRFHKGRGPMEALGYGIKFGPGNVVLRCNFTKAENGWIKDFEFKPEESKIKVYVKKLNGIKIKGAKLKFARTLGYRAVLILKGPFSDRVSNTHPGYGIVKNYVSCALPRKGPLKIRKCLPLSRDTRAKRAAAAVNEFVEKSRKVLGGGLVVVTRGAGSGVPRLAKKYKNWAMLADTPVEKAVGSLTGMKITEKPDNLEKMAAKIKNLFRKYEGVYVQIKGPDSWAHKNKPLKKKRSIEEIDEKFLSRIKDMEDVTICVTADHSTACEIRAHSADPVPVLIYSKEIIADPVKEFSEKACRKGSLGSFNGTELMGKIKSL